MRSGIAESRAQTSRFRNQLALRARRLLRTTNAGCCCLVQRSRNMHHLSPGSLLTQALAGSWMPRLLVVRVEALPFRDHGPRQVQ